MARVAGGDPRRAARRRRGARPGAAASGRSRSARSAAGRRAAPAAAPSQRPGSEPAELRRRARARARRGCQASRRKPSRRDRICAPYAFCRRRFPRSSAPKGDQPVAAADVEQRLTHLQRAVVEHPVANASEVLHELAHESRRSLRSTAEDHRPARLPQSGPLIVPPRYWAGPPSRKMTGGPALHTTSRSKPPLSRSKEFVLTGLEDVRTKNLHRKSQAQPTRKYCLSLLTVARPRS